MLGSLKTFFSANKTTIYATAAGVALAGGVGSVLRLFGGKAGRKAANVAQGKGK